MRWICAGSVRVYEQRKARVAMAGHHRHSDACWLQA